MSGFPQLPEVPAGTPERIDSTDQLSELNIQLHQARSVAAMLGATSRSADIDADDVMWAADCVATLLDVLARAVHSPAQSGEGGGE